MWTYFIAKTSLSPEVNTSGILFIKSAFGARFVFCENNELMAFAKMNYRGKENLTPFPNTGPRASCVARQASNPFDPEPFQNTQRSV